MGLSCPLYIRGDKAFRWVLINIVIDISYINIVICGNYINNKLHRITILYYRRTINRKFKRLLSKIQHYFVIKFVIYRNWMLKIRGLQKLNTWKNNKLVCIRNSKNYIRNEKKVDMIGAHKSSVMSYNYDSCKMIVYVM